MTVPQSRRRNSVKGAARQALDLALKRSRAVPGDADADAEAPAEGIALDRNRNLNDAAYEQMREALMDGHFVPGQTFTIRALATVFGTSPMPVRDALKRLVAERALDLRPNRSVVLPPMSRSRFQEILQIRLHLESMIAARAAARIAPAVIETMAGHHEQMCRALQDGESARYLAANRRFHFALYESAGTEVMLPIIGNLWMQVGPHLHQVFASRGHAASTADHHHLTLLRALRRQDTTAAAKAVWDDLSDAGDWILEGDSFAM